VLDEAYHSDPKTPRAQGALAVYLLVVHQQIRSFVRVRRCLSSEHSERVADYFYLLLSTFSLAWKV